MNNTTRRCTAALLLIVALGPVPPDDTEPELASPTLETAPATATPDSDPKDTYCSLRRVVEGADTRREGSGQYRRAAESGGMALGGLPKRDGRSIPWKSLFTQTVAVTGGPAGTCGTETPIAWRCASNLPG